MAYSGPIEDELDRLKKAAREGDLETIEYFIEKKKYDVDTCFKNYWNRTLLLICCQCGHLAAAQRVLELGADITAVNGGGWTALHEAARGGHADVIRFLLTQDPNLITKTTILGRTALHEATRGGHTDVIRFLHNKDPNLITKTDDIGNTAVHLAAQSGNNDVMKILLDHNPNLIEQKDYNGWTPLDWAVMRDNGNIVWTLIHQYNVDITHCQQDNQEKAKRLLAAEEAKQAKHNKEGINDSNMKLAFAFSLKFGKALSRELQVLMIGAENTGKSCLIASFLGEAFIEGQKSTDGADTEVCKIYCKDWSRINLSDMKIHLHHRFISQLKINALKATPIGFDKKSTVLSSSEKGSLVKVPPTENLPQPHPKDIQEASSYASTSDPNSLNAVVWDFAGQIIFHNTHSIFISEDGVPVITFNASMKLTDDVAVREGATPPAECRTIIQSIHYWLQVVDSMCSVKGSDKDQSPLLPTALLAGTHIDKLHPDVKKARVIAKSIILPILEKEFLGKPYARHLAGMKNGIKAALEQFCFFVSNKVRDEEIDRLKDCAIAVASSLRKEQPIFFLKIEHSLLLVDKQIISKSMLADIIAKCSFSLSEDSPEFQGVLTYFHTKRAILHFGEIPSLKDLIILSPRWLAKLFSYVLTGHSYITGTELDNAWLLLTKYGILHGNLLAHMLQKFHHDYPTTVHITIQQVVDILLCFHLVALINRKAWFAETGYPSIPESGDTFIVPSLVPLDETKTIPCTVKERIVFFKFETGFVPTSVLNQLIADCICRNVKKENQLLWMRHGKVGMQLGARQKYYISRCEEKQSIQLTITVGGSGWSCIQERSELIDDVYKLLIDIMKVFMPAAKKPTLFVPCPWCSILHITLKQVYDGDCIFCPLSGDDSELVDYYSDLFPNASIGANIKLDVFTKYYAKLVNVLPIKTLTHHFVKDEIISFDEEEMIIQAAGRSQAAGIVLRKIGGSLKADLTTSFDKLLSIMEQHGGASCAELVNEIRQAIPQDLTVQCLSSSQASAKQSTEPDLLSHNTTDMSAKLSKDDKEDHKQFTDTSDSVIDASSAKSSS